LDAVRAPSKNIYTRNFFDREARERNVPEEGDQEFLRKASEILSSCAGSGMIIVGSTSAAIQVRTS
jgi:hypothetical protein